MHVLAADTIAATASAPGVSVRGIIRLSGPRLPAVLRQFLLAGGVAAPFDPWPGSPRAYPLLWQVFTPQGDALSPSPLAKLPTVPLLVYLWPTGRSYTGQPLCELHFPGSPALGAILLKYVLAAGARLAQPGEFTLRAFLAGKLDLLQAEAVLGVIDAAGEQPLRTALRQLAGGVSRPLEELRQNLLNLLADLEAGLDFVDEDLQFISNDRILAELQSAETLLALLGRQLRTRANPAELPQVVLYGRPNAGKSQLFNALAGQAAAIVSPLAGTTRDYLRAEVDCAGTRVELIDTAGLETVEAPDQFQASRDVSDCHTGAVAGDNSQNAKISVAAQGFTLDQLHTADLCLLCLDLSQPLTPRDEQELAHLTDNFRGRTFVVGTKADLPRQLRGEESWLPTSGMTGQGLPELRAAIREALGEQPASVVGATAVRCEETLRGCQGHISSARQLAQTQAGEELLAAEVRAALDELGQMTGAIYTEDLLDRIFSRFCIGK
ncbi:MAG: GTPase [Pirellulales bacterium]|nr:GTPase [Pirellulales bacterium]